MPPGLKILALISAAALPLAACNTEKKTGEHGEQRVITPGGTDQEATINAVGGGNSPDAMPTVGAPGAAGKGTQPGTATNLSNSTTTP